jgi:hypothetical protein
VEKEKGEFLEEQSKRGRGIFRRGIPALFRMNEKWGGSGDPQIISWFGIFQYCILHFEFPQKCGMY